MKQIIASRIKQIINGTSVNLTADILPITRLTNIEYAVTFYCAAPGIFVMSDLRLLTELEDKFDVSANVKPSLEHYIEGIII